MHFNLNITMCTLLRSMLLLKPFDHSIETFTALQLALNITVDILVNVNLSLSSQQILFCIRNTF